MPWTTQTSLVAATSNTGKFFWFRPDAASTTDFREVTLPPDVNAVSLKPTWSQGPRHRYGVGGWTSNMVFTDDFQLWRIGIRAPTMIPSVALSAGPGITANVIAYLAYYDEATDEWSALSAPSSTLAAANQTITWSTLPTPPNPRVTHIGLFRSVDGSEPRLVMIRQVGVSSVVEAVAVGDLGFAFVDTFELFPRCRVGVVWHNRLVMAGDDDNPDTLYLSLIDGYEKQSLSLAMKSGQPIVAIANVRGNLILMGPTVSEIVTGWTEDDIAIDIAQAQIGCISHFGIVQIHGNAWIPTHLGIYVCNGSEWFYVSDDIQTKWVEEYALFRDAYEEGWGYHDPVSNVYKFFVGLHSDTGGQQTFWVADYNPVVPQVGGGYGQPNWSYDLSARTYCSGAVLAVPGGRRGDSFMGSETGKIFRENNADNTDDEGDTFALALKVRFGANFFQDFGGDLAAGKKFTDIDMFVEAENDDWTLNVYGGDEWAYIAVAPSFTVTVQDSLVVTGGFRYQTRTSTHYPLPSVTGRAITVEVTVTGPDDFWIRGYQVNWYEGPVTTGRRVAQGGG